MQIRVISRAALVAALLVSAALLAGCGGGSVSTSPAGSTVTVVGAAPATFASIGGAPTTLSGTTQSVAVPAVPGVPTVGGSLSVTATTPVTTVLTVASATSGAGSGPPIALQSLNRRGAEAINGTAVTPQYYVGITNTSGAAAQINVASLALGVNVPLGSSVALAHYDPSLPQNGWNQHCAFGPSQVNQNGNTTTFSPNANLTIYPGATLWFAPYTYPSNTAAPTPPPQSTPITPAPAAAPSSLTGTYVGSALSNGVSQYLEFSLTQSGSSLSGTFAVLPSGPNNQGSFGTLSGSVTAGRVTLTGVDQFGDICTTALTATAGGTLISGTFASQTPCSGSGTFAVTLQTSALPTISGTFRGPINDTQSGAGTLTLTISQPGTVFSGTGNVAFSANPANGGSNAIVGFVTNATTATFAVIGSGGGSGNSGGGSNCNPFGTLTINGNTLTGNYTNSGGGSGGVCSATGTFTISR